MQDLTVDFEDGRLNCRAGGIIIHNNKVLFHKNIVENRYALIGGRVKIGENSADAIVREIKEETGKDVEVTGYIATIENFFELNEKKYHEILLVHKVEFIDENDKNTTETIKNIEDGKKDFLQYEWIDIEEIDKYDIRPSVIKEVLRKGTFPCHVINNGK